MAASANENRRSIKGFLLSEIQQGATVQSLLDRVFDNWFYPSVFLNISRRIEYYSRYSSEYDPWELLFKNGSPVHGSLDGPIREALLNRDARGKSRVIPFTANGSTYMLASVSSGNIPAGFLLMHCPRLRSESEANDICSALSEAVAYLVEDDTRIRLSEFDYTKNYIARELLQFDERMGNASPAAVITEYMSSPLWPSLRPGYRIAAVTAGSGESGILSVAEKEISRAYPASYSLMKSNILYFFFYDLAPGSGGSDEKLKECLDRASYNDSLIIALSSDFEDINLRQVYRRQAVDLHRISSVKNPAHGVLEADERYPEQMLYAAVNRIGTETMLLSEVKQLRDYDKKEGTEYLETLRCYLRCNGMIRSAAEELHIQPKSLRYRINKICDILKRSREDLLSDTALLLSSIAIGLVPEDDITEN